MFYEPDRFTRRSAIPITALLLPQDLGSAATLDAEAHRHRKRMLMSLMTTGTRDVVPAQDLRVDMRRMPAVPRSRVAIVNVERVPWHAVPRCPPCRPSGTGPDRRVAQGPNTSTCPRAFSRGAQRSAFTR